MPSRYEETAPFASLLGTLFYKDPTDAAAASALAFFAAQDAAAQWPYGATTAAGWLDAMREAIEADERVAESGEAETLHEAHTRLLVGPNKLPAPPWGSVYTDHDSVIFGNKTLDVRAWMRENGVKMQLDSYEPEDHFGLLLIMFSWAVRNGVPDEALDAFLEEHLLPWSGRFLELFIEGAGHPFYEGLGKLAQGTLEDWTRRFSLTPKQTKLYR